MGGASALVPFARGLVVVDGPVELRRVGLRGGFEVVGILLGGHHAVLLVAAHGRQDGERVAFEIAQVLIGGDEGPVRRKSSDRRCCGRRNASRNPCRAASSRVGIRSICETIPLDLLPGATNPGAKISAGMWYLSQRDFGAAGARRAVVGGDEEDRIVEPRLAARRFGQELRPGRSRCRARRRRAGLRVVGDAGSSRRGRCRGGGC